MNDAPPDTQIRNLRRLGDKTARVYQERLIRAIGGSAIRRKSGVAISPTASGKSFILAGAADEALKGGCFSVLITHPNEDLIVQNLETLLASGVLEGRRVAIFAAKDTRIELAGKKLPNRTFDADIILATNPSLNRAYDEIRQHLIDFGKRGGTVFCDEGHRNSAEETSSILNRVVIDGGGSGIIITATASRTDGRDVAEPFGMTIDECLIGEVTFDEVLQAGGIVKPRFILGRGDLMRSVGDEVMSEIETTYEDLLAQGKSPEMAGEYAFRRFFRPEADAFEASCGKAIVHGQYKLWASHLGNRNLSIIHCDGTDHAMAFAREIGANVMPETSRRAGRPIRTAYIDESRVLLVANGKTNELSGRPRDLRKQLFGMAQQGDIDAIVNVAVLREGVDIPRADYSFMAVLNRSLATFTQNIGRTARTYQDPQTGEWKADHLIVDSGLTVENLKRDFDAIGSGSPELARKEIVALHPAAWRSLSQMFDADPNLSAQIRAIEVEMRHREEQKNDQKIADELPPASVERKNTARADDIPADSLDIGKGIRVLAAEHLRRNTKTIDRRLCYLFDLKAMGAMNSASAAPHILAVVVHSNDKEHPRTFLTASETEAEAFGFYNGVRMEARYASSLQKSEPNITQLALCQKHVMQGVLTSPWLDRNPAEPRNAFEASALMASYHYAPIAYEAARTTIAAKVSSAVTMLRNPKYIYATDLADLPPNRKELLVSYLRLSSEATLLVGNSADRKTAAEIARGSGIKTRYVSEEHKDTIQRMAQTGVLITVGAEHIPPSAIATRETRRDTASRGSGHSR